MGLLLRSAFWLTVVFACLPWPAGSGLGEIFGAVRVAGGAAAQAALTAALEEARGRAAKACADDPAACLGEAGALAGLAAGLAKSHQETKPAAPAPRAGEPAASHEPVKTHAPVRSADLDRAPAPPRRAP